MKGRCLAPSMLDIICFRLLQARAAIHVSQVSQLSIMPAIIPNHQYQIHKLSSRASTWFQRNLITRTFGLKAYTHSYTLDHKAHQIAALTACFGNI